MSDKLDHNSATPLYLQLEAILRDNIAEGVWQPGQRIPSESELALSYGLSRMTARAVLTQLVRDGLLYRVQGKGTFVSSAKITAHSPAYTGIREQLEAMGYETATRLICQQQIKAPPKVRQMLNLEEHALLYFIERVRLVQGQPVSLHRSYVPCQLAPELIHLDTETEQLCVLLSQKFHLQMKVCEETLETASASSADAELLGIKRGFPLLCLEDVIYTDNHQPYEYTQVLFRGDKIKN